MLMKLTPHGTTSCAQQKKHVQSLTTFFQQEKKRQKIARKMVGRTVIQYQLNQI
jgi:hypothetical protein